MLSFIYGCYIRWNIITAFSEASAIRAKLGCINNQIYMRQNLNHWYGYKIIHDSSWFTWYCSNYFAVVSPTELDINNFSRSSDIQIFFFKQKDDNKKCSLVMVPVKTKKMPNVYESTSTMWTVSVTPP